MAADKKTDYYFLCVNLNGHNKELIDKLKDMDISFREYDSKFYYLAIPSEHFEEFNKYMINNNIHIILTSTKDLMGLVRDDKLGT